MEIHTLGRLKYNITSFYRRQDEIGTPFCITIDGETLENDTVTIRDRDTLVQRRIPIGGVLHELRSLIG